MNGVILCCLLLGVKMAYVYGDGLPYVQKIECEPQHWGDGYPKPNEWANGREDVHQGWGPELKASKVKIVDFFITLIGRQGLDAAVMCEIDTDVEIEAFWLTRGGIENTEAFVFGFGDGQKNHIRIGVRGKFTEHSPVTRVQMYGSKKPLRAKVTCGAGPRGEECPVPNGNWNMTLKPRMQPDVA